MPEEPEVETEKLREAVAEELEREGGHFLRTIALTTAILAAFAAVASLQAGGTANEALVLKTEATRLQAEASDQWAYYQAKASRRRWRRGRPPPTAPQARTLPPS
jgi:class 3 adenylate cyclase